jgi:sulfatase maturation enzyme AslB (radical SAM superfamily)
MNSHVTAHGERSVCCATTKYYPYEKLSDWWVSPELRQLRIDMLNNNPPMETCESCINNTRTKSLAATMNERYPYILDYADSQTDENGYTSMMPRELEIKHILCNLKCRHCYDRSSSSIRSSSKKADIPISPLGPVYKDELTLAQGVNDIEWLSKNINLVHWTGGEPFMSPLLKPGLEKLIESGATGITKQVIITNATFNKKNAQAAIDLLKKFDRVVVIVSVDGMGEVGSFSRSGWKEDIFVENVAYLREQLPQAHFAAHYVLHAVSILGLYDTVKFCIENDLQFQGQLISFEGAHYLDYNLVKQSVFEREFERCRELKARMNPRKDCLIDELISAFMSHYQPKKFGPEEQACLDLANRVRGGDGDYQKLTQGILNG